MNKIENDFNNNCSPNLIFSYKNCFQEDQVDFQAKKFILKAENIKFLTSRPQVALQDIKNPLRGSLR